MMKPPSLKDMKRKELRKLARSYGLEVNSEMGRKELFSMILKQMKEESVIAPKSKEELIVDFVKSMVEIDEKIEPYKEHKKDLKKLYKNNSWLDAKEQKRALKAYKLLKDKENLSSLMQYCEEIQSQTGLGEEE